jgi:hypothetical protein
MFLLTLAYPGLSAIDLPSLFAMALIRVRMP